MVNVGIQLYTLRDIDLTFDRLLASVADAGFDGVEFANRVRQEQPDAVNAALASHDLEPIGAHVDIELLEDDLEDTVAFYQAIGCQDLVIPWLSGDAFTSDRAIEETASRLETLSSQLEAHDLRLHYHNHDHEYVDVSGRPGFLRLIEETTIPIELDVGFALLAGDDPVGRIQALGQRCRFLHVKDVNTSSGESVPAGTGDLDLTNIGKAFGDVDGEWLIYEYEGADPLRGLHDVADVLTHIAS